VIYSDGEDDWAAVRAIRKWLAVRPNASIAVFCGRFHSAHLRYVLNVMLDPSLANRVRIWPLDDPRYDAASWWLSRTGMKAFGIEWLRRSHGWLLGQDHSRPPARSADVYEQDALRSLVEEKP
jgi:hypothetical protein